MAKRRDERIIYFPKYSDDRGILVSVEGNNIIPFDIKRIFYIFNVSPGYFRGGHAHKSCTQVFIAIKGSFILQVDDDLYYLNETDNNKNPSSEKIAVIVTPGEFVKLRNFTKDAICLVICSEKFDENDYILEPQ